MWTDEKEDAFTQLKESLSKYVLNTNALKHCIGTSSNIRQAAVRVRLRTAVFKFSRLFCQFLCVAPHCPHGH